MKKVLSKRPLVVVLVSTVQKARRDKLSGIYQAAQLHDWDVRLVEHRPFSPTLADFACDNEPAGAIIDGDEAGGTLPQTLLQKIPVVYLDRERTGQDELTVNHNSDATARLAADHLLRLGLRTFAYVGTNPDVWWSKARRSAFKTATEEHGCVCHVYRPQGRARNSEHFRNWIASLPRPCGVFAAMDIQAANVLDACHACGLRVPQDIAVIGVDNDDLLCESCHPTLTSILPAFQHAGEMAVELLAARISGRDITPLRREYGPLRLVLRESTRLLATNSKSVRIGLEFIRQHACSGICVDDVVQAMGVARRTAELHVRRATGHSILEAIQTTRLDAVCKLLSDTKTPINLIAPACGFRSDTYLKNLFKKTFGIPMREYRSRKT